jgi:hypothetical protein
MTVRSSELAVELLDGLLKSSATKDAVVAETDWLTLSTKLRRKKKRESKKKMGSKSFGSIFASHQTFQSMLQKNFGWTMQSSRKHSYQDDLESGGQTSRSPAFRRIEQMKERKYRPLLPVAKHLVSLRALDFKPFFQFPVICSLGYLNPAAEEMVKWMRTIFNNHLKLDGPRSDGIPLGVIKNRYNTQITNAICFGLLRGKALAMNSQGFTGVSRA